MAAAVVVVLALALRLGWVLAVPSKPVGDFAMYLESAAHVVAHGAFDGEFVYMPGYVLLLAGLQALGGGWMAAKVLGALLGALAAGAITAVGRHLWDDRVGLVAGVLVAVWPAGIAVASVTGTDMPAAALIAIAAAALVTWGRDRPWRAAVSFGVLMGVAAWVRAVAMPLAALSFVYFLCIGASWRAAARGAALSCLAAALVLAPWAVRNELRYGELFFSDSHGGLTALVGANPNAEAAYSRSLNRLFLETTGYTLLAEPHRKADRAAYALAADWTAFEPQYALGLVALKARRLLGNERSLLYWPVYRAGVLPDESRAFFDRWRRQIEGVVDAFWGLLVAAGLAGLGLAVARRRWAALSLLPLQLALLAIYATFFAEARYHLPIVLLLFPPAAASLIWAADGVRAVIAARAFPPALRREAAAGLAVVVGVGAAWAAAMRIGEGLRERHRWAAVVCHVDGRARTCKWRRTGREGPSPVVGVWNGLGLRLAPGAGATTSFPDLPPGEYDVAAALVTPDTDGQLRLRIGDQDLAFALREREGLLVGVVEHRGGALPVSVEIQGAPPSSERAWVDDLRVARRR